MCMLTKETDKYEIFKFQSNSKRLDVVNKQTSEKYTFYIYGRRVTHFSNSLKRLVPYEVAEIIRELGFGFAPAIEIADPN